MDIRPKTCILDAKKSILEAILASKDFPKGTWDPKNGTSDIGGAATGAARGANLGGGGACPK